MITETYIKEWLDPRGWLHTDKNPSIDQSENKVMFTSLLGLFLALYIDDNEVVARKRTLFRRNANREWGSHWSHDEMTGLYCIYAQAGRFDRIKELPIMTWNNRLWLHPRDLAFYFYCHHRFLGLLTLWIASLAMIISCYQTYKYRDGVQFKRTDGKLLTYLRCKSMNMPLTFKICTWLIERNPVFGNWNNVARIYFRNEGHPLRNLII